MELAIAVLALIVSILSAVASSYLYRREIDMGERHFLSELWNSVLDLAHQNPRYLDINVTENYRQAMQEDERLRYDIYCHKAWGHVKEVVDRGYHTSSKFQVAIQWLVTFHYAWLEDNPGFFIGEEFWEAVDRGKSMPAVILRHRRMPTDADGNIDWDRVAADYHSLVLSPLNPAMTDDSAGKPRNALVGALRQRVAVLGADAPVEIADFGCGPGTLLPVVRDLPVRVVGVDRSRKSLEAAEQQATRLGVAFEPICADLTSARLGRRFPIIVSINSLLPENRSEVGLMLTTIGDHLDDSGVLLAILPSFDTTEYLRELWRDQYCRMSASTAHADRVATALKASKLVDDRQLQYADDGYTRQCYHTPESIEREFNAAGLELVGAPSKIYYPWELTRRFDYGYFPDATEEIWDWFVVARLVH